jgi:hypothetical protein
VIVVIPIQSSAYNWVHTLHKKSTTVAIKAIAVWKEKIQPNKAPSLKWFISDTMQQEVLPSADDPGDLGPCHIISPWSDLCGIVTDLDNQLLHS